MIIYNNSTYYSSNDTTSTVDTSGIYIVIIDSAYGSTGAPDIRDLSGSTVNYSRRFIKPPVSRLDYIDKLWEWPRLLHDKKKTKKQCETFQPMRSDVKLRTSAHLRRLHQRL